MQTVPPQWSQTTLSTRRPPAPNVSWPEQQPSWSCPEVPTGCETPGELILAVMRFYRLSARPTEPLCLEP